mmetsp:Transcript_89268/g.154618  ORF Transcript_89268/g.154618 Transcript_89268/m.154618 type:complete len:115 (-) Transcript_89268:164-508(-)
MEVDNVVTQEDVADSGDLIMSVLSSAVGAEEIETPEEGEERPPPTSARVALRVAEKGRPQQTRKRPTLATAAMAYYVQRISKSKKNTAHGLGLSAVVGAKQVRGSDANLHCLIS